MALFINNIIWPGLPADQPDGGDLHAAQVAIFLGLVNGLASPAYMRGCLCDGDATEEQEMYYQLANFVVAMLGMALLLVDRRFSAAALSSPVPQPVVRGMVWLAKVLTGGTLQFSLNVLHLCLKMLYARLILVFTA
jgi:nitrate reductase gamma subunit